MKNIALVLAGLVFLFVAIMHFVRYSKAWVILVNNFNVPINWSIYGGVIALILAILMFVAANA